MIAADPVLVARNADPVSAVLSAATATATADAGAGDGAFALTLAQMMGAATEAVPVDAPVVVPGAMPEATAMLDDLGRIATLVPEAVAAPTPLPIAPDGAAAEVALPDGVKAEGMVVEGIIPEAVVPDETAAPVMRIDGPETAVAPAAVEAKAEPTDVSEDAVAVAPAPESEDGEVVAVPEAESAPMDTAPVVVPVVAVPKPEAAVVMVAAAAVPQAAQPPVAKAKDGTLTVDAPVVAPGQPKLIRGAKPAKDSAPADKPVETIAKKDVEKQKDDNAAPVQRARAVVPDGVAVAAPPVRPAEDVAKPEVRLEAVGGAADAPAPASGSMTAAVSNPAQSAAGQAPVMTDRPGWEGVIAERIAADLSEDGSLIEMELSPDKLGNLKITLDMSTGEAQVRFVTETPEAARLIQQNEHRLSDALARAGLSLGGHETTSRDPQGDRSGRGAGGGGFVFERAAEAAPGRAPGAVPSGIVNLIA